MISFKTPKKCLFEVKSVKKSEKIKVKPIFFTFFCFLYRSYKVKYLTLHHN